MFRIFTDYIYAALAANGLAIFTNFFGTCSYFHKVVKNINNGVKSKFKRLLETENDPALS